MKPGDRRQRWNQSHALQGAIFVMMALVLFSGKMYFVGVLFLIAAGLCFWRIHTGWKLKEGRPPHANRFDAIERNREQRLKDIK